MELINQQKDEKSADISIYTTRNWHTITVIYTLPGEMGCTGFGGLLLDGKRIFSWVCVRTASKEVAQLSKISESVYTVSRI
jgi:hypothetical protein